jgi:hypothetical protein
VDQAGPTAPEVRALVPKSLVDQVIAIVVYPVARFYCTGVYICLRVIAVTVVGYHAFWLRTRTSGSSSVAPIPITVCVRVVVGTIHSAVLINLPVTVVIQAIA